MQAQAMRTPFVLTMTAAVFLLAACAGGADDDYDERDPGGPDIRGTITDISMANGEVISILVEGVVDPDTQYDKASLRVDNETEVLRLESYGPVRASRDDLERGRQVEAWIVGPVAESYPVQGYAGRIVILGD
jgi:beta-N-acetylhexosaminidase